MKRKTTIGTNATMEFDDEKTKVFENVDEWRAEGFRRFGKDVMAWKFKCPMCGHVAAVQEFKDAGAEDPANAAYEECIGRYTGKGSPQEGDSSGCNWAAYGLFGIPNNKGVIVNTGEGKSAHIFDFAEEEETNL